MDDEAKLTLHGLQQYYIKLKEEEKNRKLNDLLDALEFNQVVIFVSKVKRAEVLQKLLDECNFPSICIHSRMKQPERLAAYKKFKDFEARILVCTDLFGRGMDIERVNIVVKGSKIATVSIFEHLREACDLRVLLLLLRAVLLLQPALLRLDLRRVEPELSVRDQGKPEV